MKNFKHNRLSITLCALLISVSSASAFNVTISSSATTCPAASGTTITATADCNILASDVTTALSSGDLAINTGTGGGDINISQALSWNANRLTLTANTNATDGINVNAVMSLTSSAKLTMTTGTSGYITMQKTDNASTIDGVFQGKVNFDAAHAADGSNYLVINGSEYQLINTKTPLTQLGNSAALASAYYAFATDIDMTGQSSYLTNNTSNKFSGRMEGLGHKIYNVNIVFSGSSAVGLILYANGATVSNIALDGSESNFKSAGGFFAKDYYSSTFYNLHSRINMTVQTGDFTGYTGGIVGDAEGSSFINCGSKATITGQKYTGSIAGKLTQGASASAAGTIKNTNSYSTIIVGGTTFDSTKDGIGGLFGYVSAGNFSNSNAYNPSITISGNISSSSVPFGIGGLIGEMNLFSGSSLTVTGCSSTAVVNGQGTGATYAQYVGGLVGWNNSGTISNSYSTGNVSGGDYVGGFVGYNQSGTISNSYSTGSVSGTTSNVGGLVGSNLGTVTASFWDTQTSSQPTSSGGTGNATALMQTVTTFTGAGWTISQNASLSTDYPRLVNSGWVMAPAASTPPTISYIAAAATGTTTADLNVTISMAGTGYYIVVPTGSATPTAAQVAAETNASGSTPSFHGNHSLSSNTNYNFAITGLSPSTTYDIYFVAKDTSNNLQNDANVSANKKTITTLTPDTTPPTTTAIDTNTTLTIGGTIASLHATINEAGTGYYIVVPYGSTAPTAAQVVVGSSYTGATVITSSNASMTANTSTTFNITGLSTGTNYSLYFVAKDTSNNLQSDANVSGPINFTTASFTSSFSWTLQANKWNMTSVPDTNKTTEGQIASATGVVSAYKYSGGSYTLLSGSSSTDVNASTGLWIKPSQASITVPSNSIATITSAAMKAYWKSNSSANTWYLYGMPQSLSFPAPTDSTILPAGCTLFNLWNYDAANNKWNDTATIPATSAVWFVCN